MEQAKHCYYKYNEFFRCEKFHGEKAKACEQIKFAYISLCPKDWVRYPHHFTLINLFLIPIRETSGERMGRAARQRNFSRPSVTKDTKCM